MGPGHNLNNYIHVTVHFSVVFVVSVLLQFPDLSLEVVDGFSAGFKFVFEFCDLLTGSFLCGFHFLLSPLLQLADCRHR